jgi:hypothetical protein
MRKKNSKSRFAIADRVPHMVCTPKQAGCLLQELRRNYQALALKERNQVKVFISVLYQNFGERSLGNFVDADSTHNRNL